MARVVHASIHRQSSQSDTAGERRAKRIVSSLVREWLGGGVTVRVSGSPADFEVAFPDGRLIVEYKERADAPAIHRAIHTLARARAPRGAIPVVVVPHMGEVGRRMCATAGVSWLDLSGNADIKGPRLRILIEGRPNRFTARGRPSTPFAPKSSRVARWLLLHPEHPFTQRELARATELDTGQVSRIVARLVEDGLARRSDDGVALADRRLMLQAWRESYDFSKYEVVKGHIPQRTGRDAVKQLARGLTDAGIHHAFTGLAGAWPYTHTAEFRLVTAFVRELPGDLVALDFIERDKGANTWLVVPSDATVFDGTRVIDGRVYAHPVQIWLDLAAQPERAQEAADALLARLVAGELDG